MVKDTFKLIELYLVIIFFFCCLAVGVCAVVYLIERMHRFYADEVERLDALVARQHSLVVDAQDKLVSKDFTAYAAIRSQRTVADIETAKLNGAEQVQEGDLFEEVDLREEHPLGPMNFQP